MTTSLDSHALEYLLAQSGLSLTAAQKQDLMSIQAGLDAMKARVRTPRGHMAEPAHTYGFAQEDLA